MAKYFNGGGNYFESCHSLEDFLYPFAPKALRF